MNKCHVLRRRAWVIAIGMATLSLASADDVDAQIGDCRGHISNSRMLQVYMNEMTLSDASRASDPQLETFVEQLSWKLNSRFRGLTIGSAPVGFVHCVDRRPDVGAFGRELVRKLDDDNVILEVLGRLEAPAPGSTDSTHSAQIIYVLIPILGENNDQQNESIHFVRYPRTPSSSGQLIDLLEQADELEALVYVGVGIKLLRADQYDSAYQFISKGKSVAGRLAAATASADRPPRRAEGANGRRGSRQQRLRGRAS